MERRVGEMMTNNATVDVETLLLVDDIPDNLIVMKMVLKKALPQVAIITFQKPEEVMEYVRRTDVSVAILDVQMPVMNGLELCRLIKSSEDTRHIPVILVTSHEASSHLKAKGLDAGADDFLTRPMDNVELVARVKAALRIRRAEANLRHMADRMQRDYHVLFDRMLSGFAVHEMIFDANGNPVDYRFLDVNPAFEKALNIRAEEIVGKTIREIWPTMAPAWIERYGTVLASGRPMHFEDYAASLDRHFEVSAFRTGETQFATVFKDITERRQAEEALAAEQRLLGSLIESSPDHIYFKDLQGRFLRINDSLAREFKLNNPAEALGKTDFDFYIESDARKFQESEQRIISTGEPVVGLEEKHNMPDGQVFWVSTTKMPQRDKTGQIIGIMGISRDITQLKNALSEMSQSKKKFQALYDNAPMAFQSLDADGCFVDVNPTWLKTLGFEREDVLGKRFVDLLHPDWKPLFEKNFPMLKTSGYVQEVQFSIRHKDGHYLDVEFTGCIGHNPDGSFKQTYCVFQDITGRKRAEAEKERLLTAINQAAEAIVITDTDGTIVYVNPAFERISGYTREEALNQNPRILKSGQQDVAFYKELWAKLIRGETWSGQFVNKKKNGSLYTEEATISPVKDSVGRIVNYVAVKRDVTDEIKVEEQLRQSQKMQSIGLLVGGVAHDFNNLLQVINSYSEIARSSLPSRKAVAESQGEVIENLTEVADSLDEIAAAGARAKDLVSQLLAFSHQQVIDPTVLDLNDEIRQSLKMLGRVIGEHIQLNVVAGKQTSPVFADKNQLHQVLMNLCVNARDAMPDGGSLTIETADILISQADLKIHGLSFPGHYTVLRVADTGYGMDKTTRAKIFDPFFTTKESGRGTGLGLSTVYGIVEQNGGQIEVQSELGKGTVFTIYLPASNPSSIEPNPISQNIVPVGGGNETILVAEDEKTILRLATRFLTRAGYTVLTAKDGEEAVRVFEEHADKIDLVMMDVVMPRMGGKKAMEEILKKHPATRYLFASGYSPDAGHNDFIKDKSLHLLNKPYPAKALLLKVREVLEDK
jgi:PAS domain S-box-containing protein